MISSEKKLALITNNTVIADHIKISLQGLFDVDIHKNGLEVQHAIEKKAIYKAIITDDELAGSNGISLLNTLKTFGYIQIPFIVLLNKIDNNLRKNAMNAGIAEIFSKPLDEKALQIRIPYLIDNYNTKIKGKTVFSGFKLPFVKRVFDVVFSGIALLFLSPLFLLIAIAIRLESKGKVFYYSFRVGAGYKVFKFFKFRSMLVGADARLNDLSHLNQYRNEKEPTIISAGILINELCEFCEQGGTGCLNPLYADNTVMCETLHNQQKESNLDSAFIKIKNDPRVTRVGNFIRNTSLDELPQLWNVFIGDMSIVGNRPLPLYEAEKITTDKYALRFMAPAGITGLWQVEKRGRGEMSEEERLDLDNNYAKTHSLKNDIKLIFRTFPAMFQSVNA